MMQFHNARTSLNSIDNYMKMPVEHEADREFVSRPDLRGAIEFRNVSFSYPGSEQASLSGVSFRSGPGSGSASSGVSARARPRWKSWFWVCISPLRARC